MENKEIIIDGVDVAGCYFYYKGECRCEQNCIDDDKGETIEELFYREPEHNKWECELSKNCYYKQLKRKEQECEGLKEQINCKCFDPNSNNNRCISYNRIAEDYGRDLKKLDKLKSENEELKRQVFFTRLRIIKCIHNEC